MNPLSFAYNELLFRPLFNLLVGITNILPTHSVGFSILTVTLIVRALLLPSALHQARQMQANQSKMSGLKKELKKIQQQHKNDAAKKAEATMKLYRQAGVNPASGCLPLLIQLPILIALYRVFLIGLGEETFHFLYSFISQPEIVQLSFFGLDLTQASLSLALVAGLGQFALMRQVSPPAAQAGVPGGNEQSAQMMASMQKNMAYIFPVMTVFIAMQLPAALSLYWVASTVFGIVQQRLFKKYLNISVGVAA
jgi:YidC/Oxa1 family membrane protein insertase